MHADFSFAWIKYIWYFCLCHIDRLYLNIASVISLNAEMHDGGATCLLHLSSRGLAAPLTPALFLLSSPPCCCRIRSLMASLNTYTSKRKRKGKQEGRRGRGRPTDKRPGGTELKKRAGRTSKWQRRRQTGKRVHYQDWERLCVCSNIV